LNTELNTGPLGVALIGAGMIGKTHVAALSDAQDRVRLEVILTRNPDTATHLAEYYTGPKPQFTADLATITDNPDVHIVIVATPPSVRIDLIEALAKAGKHILLEKPVARTSDEALKVVEICEAAGVTLGLVFQHRMRPASKSAAQLIADGDLGTLGHVEIAAPLWRDQSYYDELGRGTYARDGGGVLLTQAIHTIDLALSLTGPVTRVQAMTATTPLHQMEAEDFAVSGLRLANGAVGSLTASTASFPHGAETITLHFKNATLRLGAETLGIFWRDGRIDQQTFGDAAIGDTGPVLANHDLHQAILEDFADAIRDARAPIVTGRQALAAHSLITAIETSSRMGKAVDIDTP